MTMPSDPLALLRSRSYVALLVLAAIIGAPVSAVAYFFLALVSKMQGWVFTDLPKGLGFHAEPLWWPLLPLAVAGVLVALTLKYLPGTGGHSPADGFKMGAGPPPPIELPGIVLAALATLSLGVVLGPEAPLIALGGGLGVIAVRLAKRDAPARTQTVVAAAGSFAAIATLLGSPLTGAFLLMEATGLGGTMMELVLIPGLLAAGVGSLVFIGLDAWTGLGTFSLAIPGLPHVGSPTAAEFGWALAIGVLAVPLGSAIRWLGLFLRPHVERRILLITPLVGLAVAGLAIAFAAATGKASAEVLFSGQAHWARSSTTAPATPSVRCCCSWPARDSPTAISLSSFRGGPTFPALFLGGVGGVALSHLPGLPLVAGVAMGIGAMSVVMLRLPLTSVLLASLLLASDGLAVMPLVIVAVVVAYVLSARLAPTPAAAGDPGPAAPGHPEPQPVGGPSAPAVILRRRSPPARSAPGTVRGVRRGAVVLDVELAVLDAEGKRLPLVRGEGQHRPVGILGVAHGDDVVAALLGAGHDRDLHAGAAVTAAIGGLAPRGAGQVHLSIAFLARSAEARGDSASAFSMSYSSATRAAIAGTLHHLPSQRIRSRVPGASHRR